MRRVWGYDPHSGGIKIPKVVQDRVRIRILTMEDCVTFFHK